MGRAARHYNIGLTRETGFEPCGRIPIVCATSSVVSVRVGRQASDKEILLNGLHSVKLNQNSALHIGPLLTLTVWRAAFHERESGRFPHSSAPFGRAMSLNVLICPLISGMVRNKRENFSAIRRLADIPRTWLMRRY